jgi:TPR repeat protein
MQGLSVPTDDAQAASWFLKAAGQGDGYAQGNLAGLYRAGRGVPRDLIQAYKWYRLSEQFANTTWSDELRELANLMTTTEIAEAERMASEWRPHKENPAQGNGDLLE